MNAGGAIVGLARRRGTYRLLRRWAPFCLLSRRICMLEPVVGTDYRSHSSRFRSSLAFPHSWSLLWPRRLLRNGAPAAVERLASLSERGIAEDVDVLAASVRPS